MRERIRRGCRPSQRNPIWPTKKKAEGVGGSGRVGEDRFAGAAASLAVF